MLSNRRQETTKYVLGMCTGKEHLFIIAPVCLKERKILLHSWHGISNGRNISSCIVPSLILSWGGISYQINDCSKRNLNSLYPVFSHLSSWEDDAFCPFLCAELWLSSWIDKYAEFRKVGSFTFLIPNHVLQSTSLAVNINMPDLQMLDPCLHLNQLWTLKGKRKWVIPVQDELRRFWYYMPINWAYKLSYTFYIPLFPGQPHIHFLMLSW